MTKKAARKSRNTSESAKRLEPADVLQTRMDYYHGLAKSEMAKGDMADCEKVDEYLKLAQDAAKELGPYRHGRAQASDAEEEQTKSYVVRTGPVFEDVDEWWLYSKMVIAKRENEDSKAGFESASERMMKRFFGETKPADKLN